MIYVLLGQTASGKTSLALKLARSLNLPIISADAYQCYRMMQIGTDKPTREQVAGLEYHFYDCYDPDADVNVSLFQRTMRPILERYLSEGRDVLIVGGTFLYIKALLYGYVFPEEDEERTTYDDMDPEAMRKLLLERDRKTYDSIDNRNPRRVRRALLQLDSGHTREEILSKTPDRPLYPCVFFGLETDKEEGNRKIDKRVDRMFEEGFVDEVKRLLTIYPETLRSFQSLGYRELIDCLKEGGDLLSCKELIKVHTHRYAKKQRTFLRHQFEEIRWLEPDQIEKTIRERALLTKRTDILLSRLKKSIESRKVLLAGLGGVGGIVAEGLARLGFLDVTLADMDEVEGSNLNRQILYTARDVGRKKVEAAKERLLALSPLMRIRTIDRPIKTVADLPEERMDIVLDAIDDVDGKAALYQKAKKDGALTIVSAGFGFHLDSTKIAYGTLKDVHDVLTANYKRRLEEEGVGKEEIDAILTAYPKDARRKGRKGERTVGSLFEEVNAGGLAILSLLLKKMEEEENGHSHDCQ